MKKIIDFEENKRLLHAFLQDEIRNMVKTTLEEIAKAERDFYMEEEKNAIDPKDESVSKNRMNGYYERSVMTLWGKLDHMKIPRDRDGSFRPFFLSRYQRNLFDLSEVVVAMY